MAKGGALFINKKKVFLLSAPIILVVYWWASSAPPDDFIIGPAYQLGKIPEKILAVSTNADLIADSLVNDRYEFHGYDDMAFQASTGLTFISGMNGAIWKVDEIAHTADKIAEVPLTPSGIQFDPIDDSRLFFCASRMGGEDYPADEKVGLYVLDLDSRIVEPVLLRLPNTRPTSPETTFEPDQRPTMLVADMDDQNSRAFSLCNDLAISRDGQRIYMSEPVPLARAAMGSGAVLEAIGLAPIGKLWLYDRQNRGVSLIVDNFTFVDGLVLSQEEKIEQAIIFTETTKFRVLRTHLAGSKAGQTEILWDNLPGMPDGLDRDSDGNIWIGLIKKRSGIVGWIHANPWIKPFLVRLPQEWLPVSGETGLLALSPDGNLPLYFLMHDGTRLSDISVISPNRGKLYLPVFNQRSAGIFYIDNPLNTKQ